MATSWGRLQFGLLPALLVLLAVAGNAEPAGAQELPIEHYTALDEVAPLPESAVLSVYQDSLGYVWVANYGFGLLRYDGQTMEEVPGLGTPLGERVSALQEGPYGRLWALSDDKGLAVSKQPLADYAAGAPVQFADTLGGTPLYGGGTSIFDSPFTRDAHGALWLGTLQEGIIRYRFDNPTTLVVDTLATVLRSDSTYTTAQALISRRDGSVWASLVNESLLVFEGGTLPARRQDQPCPELLQLYEDSRSTLWAGCNREGVWRLDAETNTWDQVKAAEPGESVITGMAEVAPGLLWVTSLGGGVWELDLATGATARYTRRNGLLDRNVWDVTTDRESNLWVSQNNGLSKLRANQAAIRTYTSQSYAGEQPALVGAEAMAAEPDIAWPLPTGDTLQVIAVATTGGLSLIGADGTVEHLTAERGLTSDLLLDVCYDAAGRLWVMTREGIDIVSPGTPAPPLPGFAEEQRVTLFGGAATLTRYRIGMATGCGTPPQPTARADGSAVANATVCFTKSLRPAVVCWVGNRWLFFDDDGSGIPGASFQTLAWDADGHLYAGASQGGLYRSTVPLTRATPDTLVGSDGLVPFVSQPVFERVLDGPEEPFAGGGVVKLVHAGSSVWARPNGGVTHIIEGSPPRVTGRVDRGDVDSQPNTMVYAPTTNTVWLSTGEGMIEIDATGQPTGRRVGQQDGLLFHTASAVPSLRVGSDGSIYHSSTAGLTRYRPARDRQNTTPPRLDFRRIQYTEDNTGANELEITYAALSFTSERQVRYRTRLRGYDDTWSAPTSETRARYTNLSAFAFPKTYTFEVQAANNDGVWTDTPLTHDVRVQPAWWLRWWALALYASLFVGSIAGVDRLQRKRLIQQEREKARERELAQARKTEQAYAQLATSHQELKRTQQQLVQQEKMASLGQLTAGIAHEIKNPLNFITNFSSLSTELADELQAAISSGDLDEVRLIAEDLQANTAVIEKHGRRADGIVKSMMDHARTSSGERETVDLNDLVDEHLELAYHGKRAQAANFTVTVERSFDSEVGTATVQPQEMGRVVLNLVGNAFDAVTEGARQEQALAADEGAADEGAAPSVTPTVTVATQRRDDHVEIRVTDNGPGIPEATRQKIFEPFFTTKETGKGTGLGLSMSYDIVTQGHGGTLRVESTPGEGSTFIVRLPAAAVPPTP